MKVVGVMVTYNEADRYLERALGRLAEEVDAVVVYDDRSTDRTVELARDLGALVAVRSERVPSFEQDESRFRTQAWMWMQLMATGPETLIVSVDADEILAEGARGVLEQAVRDNPSADGFVVPIAECWGFDRDGGPLVRVDGQWGSIQGCRVAFDRPGPVSFPKMNLGCGSVPEWCVARSRLDEPRILHLGYANPADRAAKRVRYSRRAGHSNPHVQSITARPTLVPYHQWQPYGRTPH